MGRGLGKKGLERIVFDPASNSCRIVNMTNNELRWLLILLQDEFESMLRRDDEDARIPPRVLH